MKKIMAIAAAAFLSQAVLAAPSFAAETHEQAVVEFSRDKWGVPNVPETTLLKTEVWNGKTTLQKDTCYFVDRVELRRAVTLPEGSMLVVRSGGRLRISGRGGLTVNGAVVVQSGAMLNTYNGGGLVIGESGAAIVNGKLAVSQSSSVSSRGYIQGGDGAQINVKGTLSLSGELVSRVKPKIYSSATVKGRDKIEIIDRDTRQRYYVEEMSWYKGAVRCWYSGEEFYISDAELRQQIIDNVESVLYQYAGEITAPEYDGFDPVEYSMDFASSNPEFFIEVGDGAKIRVEYPAGIHATFDIPAPFDTINGFFYVRALGNENPEILNELEKLRLL
ncbi:MAG: hypothetical protein K2O14_08650 [Oscillospiraceae bacterium]|nr:hypothetical protein [Oscillospiraceae bacterium]